MAPITCRYIRWVITERRGLVDYLQASEFRVRYTGSIVSWSAGAIATNPGGEPGAFGSQESASALIDGNTATKWGEAWFNINGASNTVGVSMIEIDNTTPITIDAYQYATANDAQNRDPVSWKLYTSEDYNTWTLVDEVSDASITTSRQTYTQIFPIGFVTSSFAKIFRYSEPTDSYADVTLPASRITGSSASILTTNGPQVY